MATRIKEPSTLRFIALWCISSFIISFLLIFAVVLLTALLIPWNLAIILLFSFLAVSGAIAISGFLAFCAIPVGAVHGLLRGILKRALQHAEETASPFLFRYRLINLFYGCTVGMALGAFGIGVAELLGDFRELMLMGTVVSIVAGAVIGFIVGELMRPEFQKSIETAHLPPEPFPKRELSAQENELLDDADEVMRRLSSSEAKRRWATLYALGQLSEPDEHILGAVTVLAAYDPVDYVREAARSDLFVWKKSLPIEQPDANEEITIRRVARFAEPVVETN